MGDLPARRSIRGRGRVCEGEGETVAGISRQSSERTGKVGIRSKEKEDMKIISVIFPHADIAPVLQPGRD